jgi:hypothetical protein
MYRVLGLIVCSLAAMPLSATAEQATAPAARSTSRHRPSPTAMPPGVVSGQVSWQRTVTEPRNALTTIQGNALTCTNGPHRDALVRLRDARSGSVSATQTTDEAGLFAFRGVEPGSHIVEIMGSQQVVLAASQMLNVNPGETVSGIVKLPCRGTPLAGLFGPTAQSAAAVTAAAASAALLGIAATKYTSPQ